jgi:septin family protein|tara:strand:+ start:391 stop:618 length:228 start_codon:yes stop_codon:yes gene_type:complete
MDNNFNITAYFKKQYLKEDLTDGNLEPAMEMMLSSAIDIFEAAIELDGFGEQFDEEDILEMITSKIRQAIGPRMG